MCINISRSDLLTLYKVIICSLFQFDNVQFLSHMKYNNVFILYSTCLIKMLKNVLHSSSTISHEQINYVSTPCGWAVCHIQRVNNFVIEIKSFIEILHLSSHVCYVRVSYCIDFILII